MEAAGRSNQRSGPPGALTTTAAAARQGQAEDEETRRTEITKRERAKIEDKQDESQPCSQNCSPGPPLTSAAAPEWPAALPQAAPSGRNQTVEAVISRECRALTAVTQIPQSQRKSIWKKRGGEVVLAPWPRTTEEGKIGGA